MPDLPLEETVEVRRACEAAGLELVLLATPTTPQERMRSIAAASQGFVYLVSVVGVTGMKEQMSGRVEGLVKDLQQVTDKPVGCSGRLSRENCVSQWVDAARVGAEALGAWVRACAYVWYLVVLTRQGQGRDVQRTTCG